MKFKIFAFAVLLLLSSVTNAQVDGGFTDNFSDGDFTANPQWSGDAAKFRVNDDMELQLNDVDATGNSTAMLSTVSHAIDNAEWQFTLKYDFDPSTSNYCDVYLVSDNATVNSCTAGYFVRVCGVSSTDNICLYKKSGSSSTKIIDGAALSLGSATNTFKIKVTRSAGGDWELYSDVNSAGVYTLEGEATDNTVTASSYFGVYCKYSKTRATGFHFDDISVSGTYYVDTEPPTLVSARFASDNSILLSFNEEIDGESVATTNFSLDNGVGRAVSAVLQDGDARKIIVSFGGSFTNGTTYTLTYGGMSDLEGNVVATSTTELTFVEAGTGSVVINEIMADPTPVVGLPESEYLELYNNSPDAINLDGWTLKIGNTSKVLGAYTLYPSEYVVICRDGNDTLFYEISNILTLSLSATALTNGGTTIILYNEYMTEVDKITYSSAWYKNASKKDGGWSLERIDPNNRCEQSTNWRASENENGGTPGFQNSIFGQNIDETAPSIMDLSINSANELHLTFSETIDTATISLDNFSLDNDYGNPVYAGISPDNPNLLMLMFGMSFEQNRIYNLTVENIADLCGNVMERQTLQFSTVPVAFNTIVVSEIMSKPSPVVGLPDAKYVEIYNRSDNAVSLSGWKIALGSATKSLPSVIIEGQSYLVLTSSDNAFLFDDFENLVGVEGFPSFAQGGTTISLYDKNENIIHTLTFSSSWHDDNFKAQGGYSLEMVDLNNPCGGADNWRSTLDSRGGTPGIQNSVNASNPDLVLPYPTDADVVNDTVVVYFSEVLSPEMVSAENFSVEEFGNPSFVKIVEPQLTAVKMKFNAEFQVGKVYMLNVSESIVDCSGNNIETNTQIRFGIGERAEYNDLAINELLFNPYSGGSDFVELYNRSSKVIDLKDLWISNTNEDGSVKDSYQITNISRLILPQEYCAISTDIADLYNHYNILSPENLYKVSKMPSMPDDKGTIIITGRTFDTIDIVSYDKSQHFKLLSSQDGVSLERINYDVASSEGSNWHSAAQDAGFATPGYVNSQYHDIIDAESQITLSSEVFSPDNDGYEDYLTIMYSLDVAGYSGTIAVYSSNGRLVRTLVNNQSLGSTGDIVWDGLDGKNRLCPAGIYVVYVELFNLEGKKIVEKHVVSINSRID
jgi:hypothetical protein